MRGKHNRLQDVLHLAVRVDVAAEHLLADDAFPALPLDETGPPVLKNVRLGVLLALALAKAALRAHRRDDVHAEKVDLQVFLQVLRDHVLRTPGAAVFVHFESAEMKKTHTQSTQRAGTYIRAMSFRVGRKEFACNFIKLTHTHQQTNAHTFGQRHLAGGREEKKTGA